jgi:hypothetical protein
VLPREWHSRITKTKVDMGRSLDGNLLSGIRIAIQRKGEVKESRRRTCGLLFILGVGQLQVPRSVWMRVMRGRWPGGDRQQNNEGMAFGMTSHARPVGLK